MACTCSKISDVDLELTKKRRGAPVCTTTLAATHCEVKSATSSYEEVCVPFKGDHPVSSQNVYTGINKKQLDSNLNSAPIYEEAISSKQGIVTQSAAYIATGKGKEVDLKKVLCAFVALIVLMLVVVASLVIFCGLVYSEMESLKFTLDSSNQFFQVHANAVKDLIQSYMQLNASLSALGENVEDTLNDTITVERYKVLEELTSQVLNTLSSLGQPSSPAPSCAALLQFSSSSPSGYYWVRASSGSALRVYCDVTLSCGNWTRVAYLQFENGSDPCPNGFRERGDSGIRTCGISSSAAACPSILFDTFGISYSRVYGMVQAYQFGTPDAFVGLTSEFNSTLRGNVDSNYVDGVSLTHGRNPRQHIWTFAAAVDEYGENPFTICQCSYHNKGLQPPSFVGQDYFCDSGIHGRYRRPDFSFHDDPLWDGAGCGLSSTCCSFNNPPWFHKQLPQPTTDNIEMRVCSDEDRANEDILIAQVEIYVQ